MYHYLLLLILLTFFNSCESVSKRNKAPKPVDTTAPILKLLGDANMTLPLHQPFTDPSAKAEDDFDGDISSKITTTGSVDSNSVGSYTITYNVSDKAGNSATLKRSVRVTTFANARLGVLGDATVKIYRIENNGTTTLLWQELSTQNYDLSKTGNFDTHADTLKSDELYLIEISGGKDYDSNNNGIKDTQVVENSGVLRTVVSKKDITDLAEKLNVTTLSEIVYEATIQKLKHNFTNSTYLDAQNNISTELIKDINSDGVVDYKDTLLFNPATNQEQLLGVLHSNYNRYADTIRSGKLPLLNSNQTIAHTPTYDFARDITQSRDGSKLYIADGNSGITIIDKASNKVISNIKTKDFARHVTLSADESIAYVADSKAGLSVVDIANKKILKSLPTYDANATGDHDARYILLTESGNKLYLAASKSGVLEFDTSTPENPKLIGQYDSPDIAYNIKLSKDEKTLFLADGKTGLI
ncbi:MAG: immunoglobulin-like domain-containing protein, partial [bacterium]